MHVISVLNSIWNNIEFDHADIFNELSDILKQFHHAVRTVPANGNIIFHDGDKNIADLLKIGCWSSKHQLGRKDNIQLSLQVLTYLYIYISIHFQLFSTLADLVIKL